MSWRPCLLIKFFSGQLRAYFASCKAFRFIHRSGRGGDPDFRFLSHLRMEVEHLSALRIGRSPASSGRPRHGKPSQTQFRYRRRAKVLPPLAGVCLAGKITYSFPIHFHNGYRSGLNPLAHRWLRQFLVPSAQNNHKSSSTNSTSMLKAALIVSVRNSSALGSC